MRVTIDSASLRGRSGRGITIAIIDSGANVPHPHLPSVAGGIAFDVSGRMGEDTVDVLGHGTAVAAAIHEKAPDAELHVVKVFDRALATSVPALVRALDWASERRVRLINLSLGTPNPFRASALGAAVERGRASGTVIVSAAEHDGEVWYPGTLPGVVGVRMDPDCPRDEVRVEEGPNGGLVLVASPYPRPVPGVARERNLNGISFAVANATGLLAMALEGREDARSAEEALAVLLATSPAPSSPT